MVRTVLHRIRNQAEAPREAVSSEPVHTYAYTSMLHCMYVHMNRYLCVFVHLSLHLHIHEEVSKHVLMHVAHV